MHLPGSNSSASTPWLDQNKFIALAQLSLVPSRKLRPSVCEEYFLPNTSAPYQANAQGSDQNSVSTYLLISLTQQPLQEQHQLGKGGSSLKLLFPALLHDLIAEGGRGKVRVRALEAGPSSKLQNKMKGKDAGKEQPGALLTPSLLLIDPLRSLHTHPSPASLTHVVLRGPRYHGELVT